MENVLKRVHPASLLPNAQATLVIERDNIPHGLIRLCYKRETPGREGELEMKVKRRKTTPDIIWGHRQRKCSDTITSND